jgi:hypothetical protein
MLRFSNSLNSGSACALLPPHQLFANENTADVSLLATLVASATAVLNDEESCNHHHHRRRKQVLNALINYR